MTTDALIVGVNSLIGDSLAKAAAEDQSDWVGTSRRPNPSASNIIDLDLCDAAAIRRSSLRPKITYLCAAQTNLRNCQGDPFGTRRINVEQTVRLARRLHDAGSQIVFLSSNLVFDGNTPHPWPEAPHLPATEYGRQKAEAETILLRELERVAIVRLTKVVHPHFPLFESWWSELKRGNPIRPFSDMTFCPIDLAVVTGELWALSHSFQRGIFQLSGDADISYASAADLLAKCRLLDAARVTPQTTAEAGYTTYFPKHTSLAHKPVRSGHGPESCPATLKRIFCSMEE